MPSGASVTWQVSAPRMWRCFCSRSQLAGNGDVCSTHVEMFPQTLQLIQEEQCLLHACGDVSSWDGLSQQGVESAPRMWRCFPLGNHQEGIDLVCSTHVEMFLRDAYLVTLRWCLLHACGDVSPLDSADADLIWSAPRMWRCFLTYLLSVRLAGVCSTHVEMFLPASPGLGMCDSLLHACGDVSLS